MKRHVKRIGAAMSALGLVGILLAGCGDEATNPLLSEDASASQTAFTAPGQGGFGEARGENPLRDAIQNGVTRTITVTDTGIEIRLESDDAEIVAALQARGANPPHGERAPEDVETTVTNLDNGILIVQVGLTDEAIEDLHDHAARESEREALGTLRETIVREVILTEAGVEIRITSENPEAVALIQAHEANRPEDRPESAEVVREVTNLDNGVLVTVTGLTDEAIEKIQEHAEREANGERPDAPRPSRGEGVRPRPGGRR